MIDQNLIQKINEATKDKPVFYVTNDAERALGLEKLIGNFHIVCIDHTDMVDYLIKDGVKVFCLEKELEKKNAVYRNSAKLLKHELAQKYIREHGGSGSYLMTFKISYAFEKEAEKLGAKVLNTPALLNRKYENKISQYVALSKTGIAFPLTKIIELESADHAALTSEFSGEYVIQFDRGHTGSGTTFVKDEKQLAELKAKFPKRSVRISKKINGDPYTINCCVTKMGILMSGLSFQITGVEGLVGQEGGTVGNGFLYPQKLSDAVRSKIFTETKKVGEAMKNDGYSGLFGIDFVVAGEDVYVIEINARQPASVSFVNKLQLMNDMTPMSAYHLAEFLGVEYELNIDSYNKEGVSPIKAVQVFLRNTAAEPFTVKGNVKTGIYRLQSDNSAIDWSSGVTKENTIFLDEEKDRPLIYNGEAYSIEQAHEKGFLLLTQPFGKEVNNGNELARIQLTQIILEDEGKLISWVREVLLTIKNYMQ